MTKSKAVTMIEIIVEANKERNPYSPNKTRKTSLLKDRIRPSRATIPLAKNRIPINSSKLKFKKIRAVIEENNNSQENKKQRTFPVFIILSRRTNISMMTITFTILFVKSRRNRIKTKLLIKIMITSLFFFKDVFKIAKNKALVNGWIH